MQKDKTLDKDQREPTVQVGQLISIDFGKAAGSTVEPSLRIVDTA